MKEHKYNNTVIQSLIGKKVRGFNFDGSREAMDKYIGQIGIITDVDSSSCRVEFKDEFWFYPTYSIHEHLVEEDTNVDTSEQNVDTSPQIIDLSNVEGVDMMVSNDTHNWKLKKIVAKNKSWYYDFDGTIWGFANPIEVKKVTMQQVEQMFGCRVEIVKEVSNG